jgi:DNA-binding LytR/AlgR family response regulator
MEQIKCLAVDDEAPALRVIERYISRNDTLVLAAKFRNPLEAAAWLKNNSCDILFLDVQMPQQTGVDMLNGLTKKTVTIFTTAYSDFAADAFDLDAADYLRKPFSFDRFMKAVEKASDYLKFDAQKKSELLASYQGQNFLSFKSDGKFIKIFFSEIIYIEAFQEYIKIFTERGRFATYERMKNIETLLPKDAFMRVHRSYIIPLNRVKAVSGNLVEIDSHLIPVSRDSKNELIKRVF